MCFLLIPSNVFNNPENYEIEIELIEKAKTYQANDLQDILKKGIKINSKGLGNTGISVMII